MTYKHCLKRVLILMLTNGFVVSCGADAVVEHKSLALSNPFLSLEFYEPQQGGGLHSIKNERGFEFVNRHTNKYLWQVEMKRIPRSEAQKDSIFRLSLDPEVDDGVPGIMDNRAASDMMRIKSDAVSARCSVEQNTNTLTMSWQGIDVGEEKGVLDVSVIVTLSQDDRFARFRVSFNNRSNKFTVFYIIAPVFNGIYPPDGRTDLDWLASPIYEGRLMHDPIRNGILGKPYIFHPNCPSHCMQFDAYYHDKNALYFGCFDGEQNVKRYYIAVDSVNGLTWALVHVPDNMKKVPQFWITPYDTVLRCYDGDWYDACRIYREWALKQSWAVEGPLSKRASIPKWFKEIDMWMRWVTPGQPSNAPYTPKIESLFSGLSRGLHLHNWGKGHFSTKMSPDRFPLDEQDLSANALAKKHNYAIMGFIQGISWDMETDSFRKYSGMDHTVRNFYGQRVVWDLEKEGGPAKHHVCAIAYPGKLWTSILGDTILNMAKVAGFDAAYVDSINHAGIYMNFNPLYGNQSGGGNAYIKDNREMLRQIKNQVRKVDPNFCFSGESFWEGTIAELDGFLVCNTTGQLLKKGEIFAVPMVQTVYHDYAISFGEWTSRRDLEADDGLGYIAKSAQAFIWGVKLGWVEPILLLTYDSRQIALDAIHKRARAYAAARKFLVYGEMLREPLFVHPVPELNVKWHIRWTKTYYDISMPAVLCSVWRAPDGNLGVVLYNISSQDQQISLMLNDPGYGIDKAARRRMVCLYPVQGEAGGWKSLEEPNITLSCTVRARSPLVFEIELED